MAKSALVEIEPEDQQESDLYEDRRFELIDGERVERMMGARCGKVAARVAHVLLTHADAHKSGAAFTSGCGYHIFPYAPKLVRYPDVSFVCKGRLPGDKPPRGHMKIVPDLVVEIVSPNDLAEDIETRVMDYVRVQVPLIWVLYPETRCARVLRQDGTATQLGEDAELRGEQLLPGFACPLAELFADP
jgi:Uma2 family endonuclease